MSKPIRPRPMISTIAAMTLSVGLAGAALASSDEDRDSDERTARTVVTAATSDSSSALAIDEVLVRLRGAGYSDISEIEREDRKYEVKARNPEGERVEIYLDAHTGEVLEVERDD